ncbi:MAG: ComF family protein [Anaerolineales bacterium]
MKQPISQWNWSRVTYWLKLAIDLIFPPLCAGCEVPGTVWCDDCNNRISAPKGRSCPDCGFPLEKKFICSVCAEWPNRVHVRPFAHYEKPLSSAILKLKYRPDQSLANEMASWLIDVYHRTGWEADCVVPVPLADVRLRQRGYNQVTLIATSFTKELKLHFFNDALKRVRETQSQVGLNRQARHHNVEGAFNADLRSLQDQSVVLIDDLLTSGATMKNCAIALLNAGAVQVFCLTIARA